MKTFKLGRIDVPVLKMFKFVKGDVPSLKMMEDAPFLNIMTNVSIPRK